jgi:hypothetical protein
MTKTFVPQALAAGRLDADWITSVIDVRQPDAATHGKLDRLRASIFSGAGRTKDDIVAAAGGDPAGPLGVILLIALGLAGNLRLHLNLRLRLRRRRRGPQPASPPEVARG